MANANMYALRIGTGLEAAQRGMDIGARLGDELLL